MTNICWTFATIAAFGLSVLLLTACKKKDGTENYAPRVAEDPFNQINAAQIEGAKVVKYEHSEILASAFTREPIPKKHEEKAPEAARREKIHPVLVRWLQERQPNSVERIVINFREPFKITRFPEPTVEQPRDAEVNKLATELAGRMIEDLTKRRAQEYEALRRELQEIYKARVLQTFWLIHGMLVEMPLESVREVSERADVIYVQPENTETPPPQNQVSVARGIIVSDPYFLLNQTMGWIGLLDTGLRFSHILYNNPSHVGFRMDCVNGGANCATGANLNPNDDCWNHGTSTGAIITGNGNLGNNYRGVTAITLDSLKVYPSTFNPQGGCTGDLNTTAVVNGFQTAVSVLDRVIIAEMQDGGNAQSAVSTAADSAFDAGAVIIAANGNYGPGAGTVRGPALAPRVIGVGNFDVQTLGPIASQGQGPGADNRYKPDIQTPTNTQTASNASDTALQVFSGTSGATPYAGAAAALLRNWLRGASSSIDPGQVYAQMILSGQQPWVFNNTSGAGKLRLPTDGWAWWGKVAISSGGTVDIPIGIRPGNFTLLDGAIWWPENVGQHNDVDLYLISPNGSTAAFSDSVASVFERARFSGAVQAGTWNVRIRGYNVPQGPQTVYWTAAVMTR
jgi:serine protease AprX